jgi:hypothetical protein
MPISTEERPSLGRQLAQVRPADTANTAFVNSKESTTTRIDMIIICNTSAAAAKYRIFHDDDGTTYDQTTALFYDVTLDIAESHELPDTLWLHAANEGNIAVRSDTGSALTFTAYGAEIND